MFIRNRIHASCTSGLSSDFYIGKKKPNVLGVFYPKQQQQHRWSMQCKYGPWLYYLAIFPYLLSYDKYVSYDPLCFEGISTGSHLVVVVGLNLSEKKNVCQLTRNWVSCVMDLLCVRARLPESTEWAAGRWWGMLTFHFKPFVRLASAMYPF